ncbi:MAG: hypothetical protein WCA16_12550 [Candidatus Sulfotelmatobacter sp.]
MLRKTLCFTAFAFLLFTWSLVAQTTPPAAGSAPSGPAHNRQEPCWQQAGIAKSVFEQHQEIERDAHSQVRTVCEDSSLTPQQKMEKVKEIRQQVQQKTDELITADQQKAVATCRQQRAANRPGESAHQESANPCAGRWSRQGARPSGSTGSTGSSTGSSSPPQ